MERAQMAFPLAEDRSNGAARPAAAVMALPPGVDVGRPAAATEAPADLVDEAAVVSGWVRGTTTVAVLLVAVVAAVASYESPYVNPWLA